MASEEQVLVVERKVIEQIGLFHGLMFDVDRYLDEIFASGVLRFMQRSQVENDPAYKQLIPYVIMTCDGKYLSYVRGKRAGETRLVSNRSIGIGGHINPIDNEVPLFDVNYRELYRCAGKTLVRLASEAVATNARSTRLRCLPPPTLHL